MMNEKPIALCVLYVKTAVVYKKISVAIKK